MTQAVHMSWVPRRTLSPFSVSWWYTQRAHAEQPAWPPSRRGLSPAWWTRHHHSLFLRKYGGFFQSTDYCCLETTKKNQHVVLQRDAAQLQPSCWGARLDTPRAASSCRGTRQRLLLAGQSWAAGHPGVCSAANSQTHQTLGSLWETLLPSLRQQRRLRARCSPEENHSPWLPGSSLPKPTLSSTGIVTADALH